MGQGLIFNSNSEQYNFVHAYMIVILYSYLSHRYILFPINLCLFWTSRRLRQKLIVDWTMESLSAPEIGNDRVDIFIRVANPSIWMYYLPGPGTH